MSFKEQYCYRILKTYSLLVDFKGEPPSGNVPAPLEGETYRQWQGRVLGKDVSEVVLYMPVEPAPQTRLGTLQNKASARNLEKMFRIFGQEKDLKTEAKVAKTAAVVEGRYTHFPRDTLKDILAELTLAPSVAEFFDRFQEGAKDLDTEALIRQLIMQYNQTALALRMEKARNKPAA